MFNTKKRKTKCNGLSKSRCLYPCIFVNKTRKYCRKSKNHLKKKYPDRSIEQYVIQSQFSPKYNIFASVLECSNISSSHIRDNTISLKMKLPNGECAKYSDQRVIDIFLTNLAKHNTVHFTNLLVPKQFIRNCWFNVGLMIHYVSDKGRKYNKYLRHYMITGKLHNLKPPTTRFRKTLFILNIIIESILKGDNFSYTINTNDIIQRLYQDIPSKYKTYNVGDNGNPFRYQLSLLNYIHGVNVHTRFYLGTNIYDNPTKINVHDNHTLSVVIQDDMYSVQNKVSTLTDIHGNSYELDAVLLRDRSKRHFGCFITINGKQYIYDGASEPSIKQFNWKTYLNKDTNIHMSPKNTTAWNFRKGYHVLVYYKV